VELAVELIPIEVLSETSTGLVIGCFLKGNFILTLKYSTPLVVDL
jgi:hypothetical protein